MPGTRRVDWLQAPFESHQSPRGDEVPADLAMAGTLRGDCWDINNNDNKRTIATLGTGIVGPGVVGVVRVGA